MKIRSALLAVLFGLTVAGTATAWVKYIRSVEGPVATVVVDLFCMASDCPSPTVREWEGLIRDAYQAWNDAGANFTFVERNARPDDSPCSNERHTQTVMIIYAEPERMCSMLKNSLGWKPITADAYTTPGQGFAKIYINAEKVPRWSSGKIYRLLLHELGHVVGLGHPDEHGQNVQAVMNSRVYYNELQPDDIEGILALHGPRPTLTGNLENPASDSYQSGVGIISGWVCEAVEVTAEINGSVLTVPYGGSRADTEGICGHPDTGFAMAINWNELGDGQHTIVVRVDGQELGRATVTVTTLGQTFMRNPVLNGLEWGLGSSAFDWGVVIQWSESLQNFVITRYDANEAP